MIVSYTIKGQAHLTEAEAALIIKLYKMETRVPVILFIAKQHNVSLSAAKEICNSVYYGVHEV